MYTTMYRVQYNVQGGPRKLNGTNRYLNVNRYIKRGYVRPVGSVVYLLLSAFIY